MYFCFIFSVIFELFRITKKKKLLMLTPLAMLCVCGRLHFYVFKMRPITLVVDRVHCASCSRHFPAVVPDVKKMIDLNAPPALRGVLGRLSLNQVQWHYDIWRTLRINVKKFCIRHFNVWFKAIMACSKK